MDDAGKAPLLGLMQDWPLTVDRFLEHARLWHGAREVVSALGDGTTERTDYAALHLLAKRLSDALLAHGIRPGDRVATFAMNSAAHLAAWYGIAGIGAVCHTLNPRLFDDHLVHIVNHAGDRLILADGAFAPVIDRLLPRCPAVERIVFLTPPPPGHPAATLDTFVAGCAGEARWGGFDERSAAGLCYTSGTTGPPKGVLYSHRSNFLHTLTSIQPDLFDLGARDVILPIVPLYHANAWALSFSAPAVGAKLVLPGARLDGASLHALIVGEGVTFAAAVPTVWLSLFDHLDAHGGDMPSLERVIVGGAAMPERLLHRFREIGVAAIHAWGMTEMSPIGTVGAPTAAVAALPFAEQLPYRMKQGRPPCGVEMRLLGEDGGTQPHDGRTMGLLQVRGPAVASGYLGDDRPAVDADGWFDTGDIATIDAQGFLQITDRVKDIIKSGGEWISSLDIENAALMHPQVALAAVIGVADPRWGERPVLMVTPRPGGALTGDDLRGFLSGRIARWWMPDTVLILDEMPLGATGKIDKRKLRERAPDPLAES